MKNLVNILSIKTKKAKLKNNNFAENFQLKPSTEVKGEY